MSDQEKLFADSGETWRRRTRKRIYQNPVDDSSRLSVQTIKNSPNLRWRRTLVRRRGSSGRRRCRCADESGSGLWCWPSPSGCIRRGHFRQRLGRVLPPVRANTMSNALVYFFISFPFRCFFFFNELFGYFSFPLPHRFPKLQKTRRNNNNNNNNKRCRWKIKDGKIKIIK